MINLDMSNVWGELSLPDLLATEQEVARAHKVLTEGKGPGNDYLGWLDLPVVEETEEIQRIMAAAKRIRETSDVLVVVGIGGSYLGPRAAIELLCGPNHNLRNDKPQIFFAGNTLSTRAWQELCSLLEGKDFSRLRDSEVAAFRRENLGFVFQEFNLLDNFTLEDNIYLPLVLSGRRYGEMRDALLPLASRLGISELLKKYPYELSGGQKQRGAVARAMITSPRLLLADEPTGALDSRSSDELLRLFRELNGQGQTIVMVTHSVKAASVASRVLFIRDGEVFHQLYRGEDGDERFYQRISDSLTMLTTGGERR